MGETDLRASGHEIKNLEAFLTKDKDRFYEMYSKKLTYNTTLDDFQKLNTLGSGSYGTVVLAKQKSTGKYYALKILEKKKIVQMDQVDHTLYEKRVLQSLNYPFLVYLAYAFSDNSYLYFVMPFIRGGEMFTLLKKFQSFEEEQAKFYAAQIVLALEYLHFMDLMYRDLKPENILIDETGYLRITDFGFSKIVKGRTWTLCGTPDYLAPEIVLNRGYGKAADWWSFGVLCFEMNSGFTPFRGKDSMQLYDKIAAGKYKVPTFFSLSLRDFLRNVIQVDLTKRYGNLKGGVDDIKRHRWFKNISWLQLLNHKLDAPYKPTVGNPRDTSNFERFPDKPLRISMEDHYAKEFANF